MKILFAASECVPFIKTGGLADVVGSLPVELVQQGEDARVVLPKYKLIKPEWREKMQHLCHFTVLFGMEQKYCGVETLQDRGVTYYFIDNEEFFACDAIYGDGIAEGMRYAFFCRAILEMLSRIGFVPDVLHLNDWQTGLAAAMLKTQYHQDAAMRGIRTVYSIHNLRYQGIFNWADMNARLGLDPALFTAEHLEFYGCLSCMKAGIVFADQICTVSPSYAEEIKTAYYGEQLDGLLRHRGAAVSGILNGIDTVAYDPANDKFLAASFDAKNVAGKAACKEALQKEFNLAVRPDVPLIGLISRLTDQKGLDLIERVLQDIMRMDVQIIFLGSGDKRYVDLLNWACWRYEGQIGTYIGLNEALAHRIYAGSDMFLMPSQFEPCGLSQMIALRYGSIPIVRETGGLRDSIRAYNMYTDEGNGFSFCNYNAHEMLYTIERAVQYYYDDKPMWERLVGRAMAEDFSWGVSAKKYIELYRKATGKPVRDPDPEKPPVKKTAKKTEAAAEKKSAEKKPAAKKTTAKKAAEKKVTEKKATEKKATEKKATEKKAAEKE